MNILSPRERVLKEVRNSLLSIKAKQNFGPEKRSEIMALQNEEKAMLFLKESLSDISDLFFCKNRYDFLDKFILYLEVNEIKKFVCIDKKLIQFFNSCELEHVENFESIDSHTLGAITADLFDPYGLFVSYNYNGFVAKAIEKCPFIATIAYKDQLVKSSQILFERVKNRLIDTDLKAVQMLNLAKVNEPELSKSTFILNQR